MNLPKHTVVCDANGQEWLCIGMNGDESWWMNPATQEYRPRSEIWITHILGYGVFEPVPLTDTEQAAII